MNDLPEIDGNAVAQKLAGELAQVKYHNAQLETLAEALRAERDVIREDRDQIRIELASLKADTKESLSQDPEEPEND